MDYDGGNQCKHSDGRENNKDRFSCNANCCYGDSRAQSRLQKPFECTANCCPEESTKKSNKKNVSFTDDVQVSDDCHQCSVEDLQEQNKSDSSGICFCCREGKIKEPSNKVVRSVLVYELPKPIFDDLTISKRDFVPKPLPTRALPPWHPARTNLWRSLEVPSLGKTIHQRDYTPPISMHHKRSTKSAEQRIYLTEEDFDDGSTSHEEYDQTLKHPVWRKTTIGPCETIEVCAKPHLQIWETEVQHSPTADKSYHADESRYIPEQLHAPDCEKHCYSTPLKCHERQGSADMMQPSSARAALAAMTIEQDHLHHGGNNVGFAPEVCHVEPISDGELNCRDETVKRNTSNEESVDSTDVYCCKMGNSCIQPTKYSTCKERSQDSFPENKTDSSVSYNSKRAYKTSNSDEDRSEERSISYSERGNQRDDSFPMKPEESSTAYQTDPKQFHSESKCDHGCQEPHSRQETSPAVRFNKEDSNYSPTCIRSQMNDNTSAHSVEYGVVLGPSLLGHFHGEAVRHVVAPMCIETPRELSFEDGRSNNTHHCLEDHYHNHSEKSKKPNQSQDIGHSDTETGMNPSPRSHFTVCAGRNSSQAKWWKLGGRGNVDSDR